MDEQQKYYVDYNEKEFIESINEVCDTLGKNYQYKKNMELIIRQIYNELKDSELIKDNEEILSDEQLEGCSNTLLEIFRNDPEIQEYSKQLLNMLITGDAQLDI